MSLSAIPLTAPYDSLPMLIDATIVDATPRHPWTLPALDRVEAPPPLASWADEVPSRLELVDSPRVENDDETLRLEIPEPADDELGDELAGDFIDHAPCTAAESAKLAALSALRREMSSSERAIESPRDFYGSLGDIVAFHEPSPPALARDALAREPLADETAPPPSLPPVHVIVGRPIEDVAERAEPVTSDAIDLGYGGGFSDSCSLEPLPGFTSDGPSSVETVSDAAIVEEAVGAHQRYLFTIGLALLGLLAGVTTALLAPA